MDVPINQVYTPTILSELFTFWDRFPNSIIYAGGTALLRNQTRIRLQLPENLINIDRIDELQRISRTERYLEVGSTVTLNSLLKTGKIVPEILTETLQHVGTFPIRNLATLGGSLCALLPRKTDVTAVLVALEALYEIKNENSSRWISAARFNTTAGSVVLGKKELISRIRIPLEHWDYHFYQKFGNHYLIDARGGVLIILIKAQKDILSDIRIVFTGSSIIQNRTLETTVIGKGLPLSEREIQDFIEQWENYLSQNSEITLYLRFSILRCLKYTLSTFL
jgi:CO/xanthine dehydrogenase FAD-binding subunit